MTLKRKYETCDSFIHLSKALRFSVTDMRKGQMPTANVQGAKFVQKGPIRFKIFKQRFHEFVGLLIGLLPQKSLKPPG